MIQDDDYKSPWKVKDATVAIGLKAVTYSSDLDEKPAARKEPITDTHIVDRIRKLSIGTTNVEPVVTGIGIIGPQGVSRDISGGMHTQSIIK